MRSLVATAAAALVVGGSPAAGTNPWNLRCPAIPAERAAPAPLKRASLRFFPWIRPAPKALRAGPIYLVALSSNTAISRDGDASDSSSYYLHRALIAIAPTYSAPLEITGRRIGGSARRATLAFSTDGATACSVSPPVVSCGSRPLRFSRVLRVEPGAGWRVVRTELRIGRTGCFSVVATGENVHAVIPLDVPGPDYGTAGW